jgi:hypothetical protein
MAERTLTPLHADVADRIIAAEPIQAILQTGLTGVTSRIPTGGPTQTTLQTGLSGVIGCDFIVAQNELIFVEYGGNLSSLTVAPATPAYRVLGSGYTNPEDVKISKDGVHAYVVERSGDLVKVALASANRSSAAVIATGMTAPQQLFLDEAHNAAYVVEYKAAGTLLKINLSNGAKTVVCSTLNNPVGVVLTSDLQYAYVSEQTTGPEGGRVSEIQISTAARTTVAKGLTSPFFLAWADEGEDSLYVPQRDPSNSIVTVSTTSGTVSTIVSGVSARPSSVAAPYAAQMYICCNTVIELVTLAPVLSDGPLLVGIGFIPATNIDSTTGRASTPANSIYPVNKAPFGGTLPIMVNYESAVTASPPAAYYQVVVDTVVQTGSWTVYFWNGVTNVLQTVPPITVGPSQGCYPVHSVADLFLYQPQALGYELDTTALTNGFHTIALQFLNMAGAAIPGLVSTPLKILVNNQQCIATLVPPVLNTTPITIADGCGVLHYGSDESTTVTINFTASQPANWATYSVSLVRGVTSVAPPVVLPGGPVPGSGPLTTTVANLLKSCPTAGFAAEVYVAASMTNGFGRQSQYDAEALMGFVLTN